MPNHNQIIPTNAITHSLTHSKQRRDVTDVKSEKSDSLAILNRLTNARGVSINTAMGKKGVDAVYVIDR